MSTRGRFALAVTAALAYFSLSFVSVAKTASIDEPCLENENCGNNAECWKYSVHPECKMGVCKCKSGYRTMNLDPFNCYQPTHVPLNSSCEGNRLEVYPVGAKCYGDKVVCNEQYEFKVEVTNEKVIAYCSLRSRARVSLRNAPCSSNADCNPEIGLFCNLAWKTCECYGNYMWRGNTCEEAYYGTACETDANCQTGGTYASGGPGGGGICSATRHTCECNRGYTAVNYTQYIPEEQSKAGESYQTAKYTWTICVASESSNAVNMREGEGCTVPYWSSDISPMNQLFCEAGLGCIVCPEDRQQVSDIDATNIGRGICRSNAIKLQSNFGVAALLTSIYLVGYIVKLLTIVFGY